MGKLKIAVVGPGLIGKKHLQLVHEEPTSCVGAIVAPDHQRHHVTASAYGVPLYHDVETMLGAQELDGAIIASPNIVHVDQGLACLEAGVPVLVEKPIAHTFDAGRRLVEMAEQRHVPLMVGHHRAHSPIMKAAREIIRNERLGRIVAIMGSALFYKPDDYFEAGPWRKEIGGGPILINLIHEIGNLRALCGEIASVQAISTSATRKFAVEDTAALNFEFSSGALGVFILSDTAASARSWEQTSRENPSYPAYDDEDCYVISGTSGTLAVPTMRLKCYRDPKSRSWWKPFSLESFSVEREDPLKCQLGNFLNVIQGLEAPVVSGHDGLQNLRVVEAIFESIKRKAPVSL
ncbi:MAG TPA: Gfo/Idh/MocA family oxidoreductase [Nitrospira sp.]|nr:Gfo/Idh/MocA family oxidoreductase [Nitrospira sp.]